MSEKYPDTPAGRKAARDSTPNKMEYWEEKVDFKGIHIADDDQIKVVVAVAETARNFPELFDEDTHQTITSLVNQVKEII